MSTTTSTRTTPLRTTPSCDPIHVPSPRLRPPCSLYSSTCYRSPETPRSRKFRSFTPATLSFQTRDIDPFLAQYIKPTALDFHQIYFSGINKHTRISNYDYYKPYLRPHRPSRPLHTSAAHRTESDASSDGKPRSLGRPLHSANVSDEDVLLSDDSDSESEENKPANSDGKTLRESQQTTTSSRRRRHHSGLVSSPAPTKKPHLQVLVQRLPQEFMRCPIDDLITLIHRMLQSLINLNDQSIPESISNPSGAHNCSPEEKKKLLTRFHSRTPPAISIQTYLARLTKFNNFTQATLLTTIYYIDLLSHNYQPYFTLNSWTVHRFLLVATMLAQKALEDYFFTNDHYAKVGGVALTELNCLELDFLNRVGWKLVPAKQFENNVTSIKYYKEVLHLYYVQLISLMGSTEHNNVVFTLAPAEHV